MVANFCPCCKQWQGCTYTDENTLIEMNMRNADWAAVLVLFKMLGELVFSFHHYFTQTANVICHISTDEGFAAAG